MFGENRSFYNATVKRMVAVFGSLFNDIVIDRRDNDGNVDERFVVPIGYGPGAKWIARLNAETDNLKQTPAVILPRISFEIDDMSYDGTRRLTSGDVYKFGADVNNFFATHTAAPYDITFSVSILCKYSEDGSKIIEQILPYFKPEWTTHVKMLDDVDLVMDIPIILTDIANDEIYESDFTDRRVVQWSMTFVMKTYFFGPTVPKKIIKFIDLNYHADTSSIAPTVEETHIQPGMTKNRKPTTKISESIHYNKIEFDDPFDFALEHLSIEDYYKGKVS